MFIDIKTLFFYNWLSALFLLLTALLVLLLQEGKAVGAMMGARHGRQQKKTTIDSVFFLKPGPVIE
jgi:hypothetical protein